MRRAVITGAVSCLMVLAAVACGTASPPPSVATGATAEPTPGGVATGKAALVGSSTVSGTCQPLPDVAPTGSLPAPGHLPAGSTMAAIYARHYLRVGVDQTTQFFGYRYPDGTLNGFDIQVADDIAKAIFGTAAGHIRYTVITSAQRIPDIQHGTLDIVADSMTITCDRLAKVAFSSDYFNAGQTILVPASSPVTNIRQLGGKRVCAAAGTTSIAAIAQVPHVLPVAVQNWTDCLVMLQQGQVEAISTDNSVLAGLQVQDPQTVIPKTAPFTCEPHGLAMSKSPGARDFVRFVNGVLEQMRTDGEWQRLYDQWVAPQLGQQTPPPAQYNVAVPNSCPWG